MARPRKSNNTKLELLDAGMHLLTENGYHGTGIKQILDAVNVPKGSFYNFFNSKEHFVENIITYYGDRVVEEFTTTNTDFSEERALTRLWLYFRIKVINRYNSNEPCACLLGVLSAEIAQSSAPCRIAIANLEQDWISTLSLLFNQAQLEGDILNNLPTQEIASAFLNCWQGSLLEYQLHSNPNTLMQRLRTFINLLLTDKGHQTILSTALYYEDIPGV